MQHTVSPDNKEPQNMQPNFFIVIGPSAVGKGTVLAETNKLLGNNLHVVVSHTTRAPRDGEINGVHYHFVDRKTFEGMIRADAFLEWAAYPPNAENPNYYGTSRDALEATPAIRILEIELQGALQVLEKFPDAPVILIEPASFDVLAERISSRGQNNPEETVARLEQARVELEKGAEIATHRAINETGPEGLKRVAERLRKILTS